MKKFLLISVVSLLMMSEAVIANGKVSIPSASPNTTLSAWIGIKIIFHRPKLNCERGFGICFEFSAGLEDNPALASDQMCPVKFQLNEKDQLVMQVEERELARYEGGTALPNFKDRNSITLQDPVTLSADLSRALGSSTPLTIKAGVYPVSYGTGIYTVVFQL